MLIVRTHSGEVLRLNGPDYAAEQRCAAQWAQQPHAWRELLRLPDGRRLRAKDAALVAHLPTPAAHTAPLPPPGPA